MSDTPQDRDLLAAEYVLGALAPEQARAFAALAASDPALARSVAAWQERLAPLTLAVRPCPPPDSLWHRLDWATGSAVPGVRSRRPSLWRSVGLWRASTAACLALAASLGFLLLTRVQPEGRPLLAALAPAGAPGAVFLVRVDGDGHAVIVASAQPNTPEGKALELWALRAGAAAPVSLGVLPRTGPSRIVIPDPVGTQLLVSQEPPGGSPTGQPTGPVVYSGTLTGA